MPALDLLLIPLLAALASPEPAAAGRAAPPQEPLDPFPDSPMGELGRLLVDALNSGDRAQQEEFVRTRVSRAGLEELPLPERVAFLRTISEQSGGLQVRRASGSEPLEMIVQSRKGGHWVRIYAFADRTERDKLREYGVIPIRDPALEPAAAWPGQGLEEAEVVREIEQHLSGAVERDEFSAKLLEAELTDALTSPHGLGGWYGYGFQVRTMAGKELRGHGGGGPGSGISSELGWFVDGSYTAIVLANYDMPGATEFFDGLMEFLARQ